MRKITVTRTYTLARDTTATECVSCDHRDSSVPNGAWNDRCAVFDVALDKVSRRNFVRRAPECIAAEKVGSGARGGEVQNG